MGMVAVRDVDDLASFTTEEAVTIARNFAMKVYQSLNQPVTERFGGQ
jgi:hypothetical protein